MNKSLIRIAIAGWLVSLAALTHAQDPGEPFQEGFESFPAGEEPPLFIIDGSFTVEEEDGNKFLQLGAEPLVEGSIQLGDSLKGGGEIQARIYGSRKRRAYPRFGVALHGLSGYRLRVVPARGELELVRNEEVIQTAPLEWSTDQWYFVKLRVELLPDGAWSVSGRSWPESAEEPDKAQIEYIGEEQNLSGKGSVVGTPYSGHPLKFDDVVIRTLE